MSENTIQVEVREAKGKGAARKLRAAGRIPGVLYGKGSGNRPLSLDPHALSRLLAKSERGLNTLIDVEASNDSGFGKRTVLVKELQREPVRGTLLHADLFEVDLSQTVLVSVPVHLTGTPTGVSLGGGILDHNLRELEIECLPTAIPDSIDVDVVALEVGDSVHVRDLALPQGVELRSDADLSIASVVAPAAEEEVAAPVEGEEGAEAPAEGDAAAGEGAPADGDGGGDGEKKEGGE